MDRMLDDLHKYIEEKNTLILYYRNNVKLLEYLYYLYIIYFRAQMIEKDKAQAEYRVKSNSDKSELAGILHQIKTRMMEKGLVSAEELDEYKAKYYALQNEYERAKKEIAKRISEESPKIASKLTSKTVNPLGDHKKDAAVQCLAERQAISPDKTMRDLKNMKIAKGLAGIFDDFSSGYTPSLVKKIWF